MQISSSHGVFKKSIKTQRNGIISQLKGFIFLWILSCTSLWTIAALIQQIVSTVGYLSKMPFERNRIKKQFWKIFQANNVLMGRQQIVSLTNSNLCRCLLWDSAFPINHSLPIQTVLVFDFPRERVPSFFTKFILHPSGREKRQNFKSLWRLDPSKYQKMASCLWFSLNFHHFCHNLASLSIKTEIRTSSYFYFCNNFAMKCFTVSTRNNGLEWSL